MVAALAGIGVAAWRERGRGEVPDRRILQLSMVVFAMVLLLKMILNASLFHYGFVLAMPATLLLIVSLTDWIPAWLERWGASGGAFRAAVLAGLAVAVTAHLRFADASYARKTFTLARGADRMLTDGRGAVMARAVEWIEQAHFPREATL